MTNYEVDMYGADQAIACITNMNGRIKDLERENRTLQGLIKRMEKRITDLSKQLAESESKAPSWYIERNVKLAQKVEELEAKVEYLESSKTRDSEEDEIHIQYLF